MICNSFLPIHFIKKTTFFIFYRLLGWVTRAWVVAGLVVNTNTSSPPSPPPPYLLDGGSAGELTNLPPFRNNNHWKLPNSTSTTKLAQTKENINRRNEKQERIINSILDLHQNTDARLPNSLSSATRLGYRPLPHLPPSNALPSGDKTDIDGTGSLIIYALDIARTVTAAGMERKIIKDTSYSALQGRTFPLFGFLSFLMLLLNSLLLIIQNVNINNNNNNNNNFKKNNKNKKRKKNKENKSSNVSNKHEAPAEKEKKRHNKNEDHNFKQFYLRINLIFFFLSLRFLLLQLVFAFRPGVDLI